MEDPASLQNLHDIVVPGSVAWWPPAPGWYAVMALAAVGAGALLWKAWRQWRRNRYRGEALSELSRIGKGGSNAELSELPVLLKRAALSAWPREYVAGLVGPDWHRFLDESAGIDRFRSGAGVLLDKLAYASGGQRVLSGREAEAVLDAARLWIRRHRVPGRGD